jgi:hypothetical protein
MRWHAGYSSVIRSQYKILFLDSVPLACSER